jgi:hypothetical protein
MVRNLRLVAATLAGWLLVPAVAWATTFQFEVVGASEGWIVIRENIPASSTDTAACTYAGIDPSRFIGATVHFFALSEDAKRGQLVVLGKPQSSMPLYAAVHGDQGCTSEADADRQWKEIVDKARGLGIEIPSTLPTPKLLGEAVQAKRCELIDDTSMDKQPCRREFRHLLKHGIVRIAVSLTAIPEAPDKRVCQYVGHRFGVAIQVGGLDFGKMGSVVAPGGFANHYDCRSQQFNPVRLYSLDDSVVLLGSFSGTNIADRDEYAFFLIFPTKPAR